MSTKVSGAFTMASVGTGIVVNGLGINPNKLRFRLGANSSLSSKLQVYEGSVDSSGYQGAWSQFGDGSGNDETRDFTTDTKCILVREYVPGTGWVTRIDASFNSYITDGFKLDVASAYSAIPCWVDAED